MVVVRDRIAWLSQGLRERGLSAAAVVAVHEHMRRVASLGGLSLHADLANCTLQADGGYAVPESNYKPTGTSFDECFPTWELCTGGLGGCSSAPAEVLPRCCTMPGLAGRNWRMDRCDGDTG